MDHFIRDNLKQLMALRSTKIISSQTNNHNSKLSSLNRAKTLSLTGKHYQVSNLKQDLP